MLIRHLLYVKHCSECVLLLYELISPSQQEEVCTIIIPILQMGKLRPREVSSPKVVMDILCFFPRKINFPTSIFFLPSWSHFKICHGCDTFLGSELKEDATGDGWP